MDASEYKKEIWKDIPGWEGLYQASSLGRIRKNAYQIPLKNGKTRHARSRVLVANGVASNGYPTVGLYKPGESVGSHTYTVHSLIAKTFIPNPEKKPTVNHKNGIKTDNRVDNLEWATYSENNIHAYRVLNKGGVRVICEETDMEFRTITEAAIWLCAKAGYKNVESAIGNIASVIRGDRCTVSGYHWKKKEA